MSDPAESITSPTPLSEQQPDAKAGASPNASRPAAGPLQAAPLLMGVKLPIRVLFGRARLCLRDIAQLGSGAVVELDCCPDDPVEIIVNDRVIAQGEVVVVSGNYGVRITKIASRHGESEPESEIGDLFSLSEKLR